MKEDTRRYSLPRWAMVALSAVVAVAIAGSGTWSASASVPAQSGGDAGRMVAQDRTIGGGERDAQPNGGTQYFEDVPPSNTFFTYINTIFQEQIIGGYLCGGPGEPCGPGSRPYYRPGNVMTRGQMAKIASNAQNITTNDIVTPFKIVTNAARGLGVWGGTGGVGPSRDINNINAGLYGFATGATNSLGLLAVGTNDNGAWITSNSAASYGLAVVRNGADIERGGGGPTDALYVGGHATITGGCTGCTLDEVMMNTGATDLHPGDVVALGALAPEGATFHGNPVAGVSASSSEYNTGVVGVVDLRYIPGDPNAPLGTMQRTGGRVDNTTAIKPGEYMTVITHGTYKMVKVDAGKEGIHAGDLLTTAGSVAGAAMKATDKVASIGAVVGKAMGNLESGIGYIPVLVTLK